MRRTSEAMAVSINDQFKTISAWTGEAFPAPSVPWCTWGAICSPLLQQCHPHPRETQHMATIVRRPGKPGLYGLPELASLGGVSTACLRQKNRASRPACWGN